MATRKRAKLLDRAVRSRVALAVAAAFLPWLATQAHAQVAADALPTGGQTAFGSVTWSSSGAKMDIVQSSATSGVNWQSFSIGSAAAVSINMLTGASGRMLNRVVGNDPSHIFGRLTSNGQVFLVNNAGVFFAPGASVNANAILASTLSITDQDFIAGRYQFSNPGNAGSVVNQGHIVTANGYTALVGPQVRNDGIIVARTGSVALAAGERVSLDLVGDGLISVSVDQAALNASVINTGRIEADGGTVLLAARSANALLDTVINSSGIIRANSLVERNGEIVLDGGSAGVVANSGTLQVASADAGGTGGTVKVLGKYVGLLDGTRIDASGEAGGGTVLVGGNYQGNGPEQNAYRTFVGSDARITADAATQGDGGKVIVWSDDSTGFLGRISARGGALGGKGGFAEVSGKVYLAYRGFADLRATDGSAGTLLLDPESITISNAASSNANAASPFEPQAAGPANLNIGDLTIALTGADVTVRTQDHGTASATDPGNLTLVDTLDYNGIGANRTLTLQAHNDVIINASILDSAPGGEQLSLVLRANDVTGVAGAPSGAGAIQLGADVNAGGGSVTFQGTVNLTASVTVAGNAGVTFIGTVNGGNALTVNSTGTTRFNAAVGNSSALTSLSTDAGGTTQLNGNVTTTGAQTYNDNVRVDSDVALTTTNSAVLFSGTVDSQATEANDLTVNAGVGNITFTGAVGAGINQDLGALAANSTGTTRFNGTVAAASTATDAGGTTQLNGNVTTTGAQTYNDNVRVDADVALTSTNSPVLFSGTVDSQASEANDLTVNAGAGNITFTGTVGAGDALGALAVNSTGTTRFNSTMAAASTATDPGGTTQLNGNVITSGLQIYGDNVRLDADVTLTTAGSLVLFNGAVVSQLAEANDLTINAGSGSIAFGGAVGAPGQELGALVVNSIAATSFNSAVQAASITTDAGGATAINGGLMSTSGAQTYNDDLSLGTSTSLTATTAIFNGTVFGGNNALSVTGSAVFGDAASDIVIGVTDLSVSGTTAINTATITTSGTQSYGGTVTLGASTTLTAATATFNGAVVGGGNALAITGGTVFGDTVTGVTDLSVNGPATINTTTISTSGAQNYAGVVTLGADATLTGTTPTFGAGVAGAGNDLTLTFSGPTTIDGTFTGIGALTSNGTGTTNLTGAIATTGAQTYADDVILTGNTTLDAGANAVTFGGTVNGAAAGAQSLTVNSSAATTFGGAVGATQLSSLTTDGAGSTVIVGGSVSTSGAQTYNDTVMLGANATLTGTTPTFGAGVNGAGNDLTLSFSGPTTIDGAFTGIGALTSNGTGTTSLTGTITTIAAQTYTDNVVLTGNTTLNAAAVSFGSTVDAAAAGIQSLTVNAGGATTFGGAVGTTQLSSLTTDAAGTSSSVGVNTSGATTFNDNTTLSGTYNNAGFTAAGTTTLSGATTVSAGAATAAFNGAVSGPFDLVANSTSLEQFGSTINVASITTDAPGSVSLGGSVTTTGSQSFNDAVTAGAITLNAGGAVSATNAGNNFAGAVTASGSSISLVDANALTASITSAGAASLSAGTTLAVSGTTGTTLTTSSGGATTFGATNVGTDLATTSGGAVSGGPLDVNGTTTINAGGNSITLADPANDFSGALNLTGGTTQVTDVNALTLGDVSVAALTTISTGNITQTGAVIVAGATNLQAGAGSITLTNAANDFGGVVQGGGTGGISLVDANTLTLGPLNAGSGVVNLTAGSIAGTGPVDGGSGTYSSNTNVIGLGTHITNDLTLTGAATLWNFGAGSNAGSFFVTSNTTSVQIAGVTFVASLIQQQTAAVIGSVAEQVGAVIVEEANKTFGTDSVAEDVEYGFAGEIGATPPMDHRIDESGISLPRCVQEAREGLACK